MNEISYPLSMADIRVPLNMRQETILALIREKGRVTVRSILPQLGISDRAVRNYLHHLVKIGLVKMEGSIGDVERQAMAIYEQARKKSHTNPHTNDTAEKRGSGAAT